MPDLERLVGAHRRRHRRSRASSSRCGAGWSCAAAAGELTGGGRWQRSGPAHRRDRRAAAAVRRCRRRRSRRRSTTTRARRSTRATSCGRASREELDHLRLITRDVRRFVAELEAGERERTGIKSLKVGYNRVFGYYIEVSKANAALAPEHYERRQSLVNAERYATPQLREYESADPAREGSRVRRSRRRSSGRSARRSPRRRRRCSRRRPRSPSSMSPARWPRRRRATATCGRRSNDGDAIEIRDGRHPMVERVAGGRRVRAERHAPVVGRRADRASSPGRTWRASRPTCGRSRSSC